MKSADSNAVVREFASYLKYVEAGGTIRITKSGQTVARLAPDRDFMPGNEAARVFNSHSADALDQAAADSIAEQITKMDGESDHALAH